MAYEAAKKFKKNYLPQLLDDGTENARKYIRSLIRVDILSAQRHLSDENSSDRHGDLSKRLHSFYQRNLDKFDHDFVAVRALANSESELNRHLAVVFEPTLESLKRVGYPAEPENVFNRGTSVHYGIVDHGQQLKDILTLPDKYNGLGFKNLIYMVIELLDFHQSWETEELRPLLHLIVIEEPEVHLHTQIQQVFIQKVHEVLPPAIPGFNTQIVITTHSPHITYACNFKPIRYFRRVQPTAEVASTKVLNLSKFKSDSEEITKFLIQYIKLTHCDLFFADAAILVEGNVERILLPLMMEKSAPALTSKYITVLELGGAFAHLFRELIEFLGLTTLVITDLDSVLPVPPNDSETDKEADDEEPSDKDAEIDKSARANGEEQARTNAARKTACMTNQADATTSNQTLIKWLPKLNTISELLRCNANNKLAISGDTTIRVAYQTESNVEYNGEKTKRAGRTFEEQFAIENLALTQNARFKSLGLFVVKKTLKENKLGDVLVRIHKRVKKKGFEKTNLALSLIMLDSSAWIVPYYIDEGLKWLESAIQRDDMKAPASQGRWRTRTQRHPSQSQILIHRQFRLMSIMNLKLSSRESEAWYTGRY